MADATCMTCPFWERHTGSGTTLGQCHHVSTATLLLDDQSARGDTYWCSEHPGRQRDRLAAMAMQGIMASSGGMNWTSQSISEDAYAVADAMLAAREKERTP